MESIRSRCRRVAALTPTARRLVGWHLVVVGTGVAALWAASLPSALEDGMLTYAGTQAVGNIAVFQVVAEAMMASTALAAGVGVLRGHRRGHRGRALALVANSMLAYSAVDSSGWLLHNQPAVLLVTAATFLGSATTTWVVFRGLEH